MSLGDKTVWSLGEAHMTNEDDPIIWSLGEPYVVIDSEAAPAVAEGGAQYIRPSLFGVTIISAGR